jgi:type I restriction enzyme S subunit
VLKYAFEGKLTNKNVKDGELPKGWKWVNLKEIGRIETGTTPSKKNPDFYGSQFPFYKPTDLNAGNNVYKSLDGLSELGIKEARYVPKESILITCIGATIGKTGFIKTAGGFNQQINAIVPSKDYVPKYIYYQAICSHFQKQITDNASATTLPILNKGKFEILEMIICTLEEQRRIVEEIESRLSVADKLEETITASLQQSETMRQSILKKAFEGKLV